MNLSQIGWLKGFVLLVTFLAYSLSANETPMDNDAEYRRDSLKAHLSREGKVKLSLRDTRGATPKLRFLHKDTVRQWVASSIKTELGKRFPKIVEKDWFKEPGLVVLLESLTLAPGDKADHVRLTIHTPVGSLAVNKETSFLEIVRGGTKALSLEVTPFEAESEKGSVRIEASFTLRFDREQQNFDVATAKSKFLLNFIGLETEEEETLQNIRTEKFQLDRE